MNKGEFLKAIAAKGEYTLKEATAAYDAFIGAIADGLNEGEKIQLAGFGTFSVKKRAARKGFNPMTGKPINIAASKAPNLKFSDSFKSLI